MGSVSDPLDFTTHRAVFAACSDLGINQEHALWSIKEYGERNQTAHRNLITLREKGEFTVLAKILYADREDINCTFSEFKDETDLNALKYIIQSEIDRWFDSSDDPSSPAAWIATQELRQVFRDAKDKANKPSKEEVKQANNSKAKQRSEDKAARHDATSTAESSTGSKKRVASTEEPKGSEVEKEPRTSRQRFAYMAKKYKLEQQLARISAELDRVDADLAKLDDLV